MALFKVLGFLIFVCAVQSADVETMENTFNCYSDYLKRHGLLEGDFKTEPFNGESYLCEAVLSTTVEGIYKSLREEFTKMTDFKDAAECIVETLKRAKWSDLDIKEQVIETSSSLSDKEKEEKIRILKNIQNRISNEAIVTCMGEKEFGELFDQIFSKDEQEDYVGDYCARRYAIDNNLLDPVLYHVIPNPNKIITSDIDCNIINQHHLAQAELELRQHLLKDIGEDVEKADCLIKKYHDNHYFNKTLAIALLGELNITEEQRMVERDRFIRSMEKITKELAECHN